MKRKLAILCIFLTMIAGFGKLGALSAQVVTGPAQPNASNEGYCQNCSQPVANCYCTYDTPGCYPSAPVCGTTCGVGYLSMALAIGVVVGVAAILLTGSHAHSH